MEAAEAFSLNAGAFGENAQGIAALEFSHCLAHGLAVYGAALHREGAELADHPAEDGIFEKFFFRHIVNDAATKSHAHHRRVPVALVVRRYDDGAGLGNIFPAFHFEP